MKPPYWFNIEVNTADLLRMLDGKNLQAHVVLPTGRQFNGIGVISAELDEAGRRASATVEYNIMIKPGTFEKLSIILVAEHIGNIVKTEDPETYQYVGDFRPPRFINGQLL